MVCLAGATVATAPQLSNSSGLKKTPQVGRAGGARAVTAALKPFECSRYDPIARILEDFPEVSTGALDICLDIV